MFTAWKNGPEDNSLEGRKKRLFEMPMVGDNEVPRPEKKPEQVISSPNRSVAPQFGPSQGRLDAAASRLNKPLDLKEPLSPLDTAREESYHDDMVQGINGELQGMRSQGSELMDKIAALYSEKDELIEERQKPLRDYLSDLRMKQWRATDEKTGWDAATMRANAALAAAKAETYDGKQRSGIGAELGYDEVQNMVRDAEMLKSQLGKGDRESIEKFVKSRKIHDYPIEVVKMIMKGLPDKLLKTLKSTSGLYSKSDQDYYNPETGEIENHPAHKLHFGGFKPDGTEDKRGGQATQKRLMWLLKTYLDQGGVDPITSLPLDYDYMELDHAIDKMNPEDEEGNEKGLPRLGSWQYRDHPDNWLWTSTSVNKSKLTDSYEKLIDDGLAKKDLKREDFVDRLQQLATGNDLGSALENKLRTILFPEMQQGELKLKVGPGRPVRNFAENHTTEMIDQIINDEGDIIKAIKDAGGGNPKPHVIKDLMRTLGLKTDQTQVTAGRPDGSTPDDNQNEMPSQLWRPLLNMMVGKSEEDQETYRGNWKQAGIDANNEMLELAMNSPEQLAELMKDNKVIQTLARDTRKKKKGELNRKAVFERLVLRKLHELGMVNPKAMQKYETSTRKGNPTANILNALSEVTGKSLEDLLQ